MGNAGETCNDCGSTVDPLELFPKHRCLACHASSSEVRFETRHMTADRLARMWGC